MEYIGEKIGVLAGFGGKDKFRPVRFRWGGRVIEVRDVTYMWTSMEGGTVIYNFSVTDGGTAYELSYNSRSLIWVLERTEAGS